MSPDPLRAIRWAMWLFIVIGVFALVGDFTGDPVPSSYIAWPFVLIGFCGTILYAIHKAYLGNSN
jgi:FtsH-binding integral membrane protein